MKLKIFTPLFLLLNFITFKSFAQVNMELLGHLEYDDQLSNLCGWSDGAGKEYAIVGTYDGTSIVDVTNPAAPVEVQFVDGNNSIWREVRTWSHYAYVVTEAGGGLLCIDLAGLPGSLEFNYTDCGIDISSGHTVFADENGFIHVFGSNVGNGGDQILDANTTPLEPVSVGEVDTWYIHDGFVRGDTLWAGNIYNGWFSVWNIADKSDPEIMGQQTTPYAFTHNAWLTDDNKFIFTTDEVTNATVASYDVSDLSDIKELDQFRANPGTNSIPHNVMVRGDFLVTAYYRDGVIVTDATYPDNLIKTGWYDTSPLSGDGFNGCWGSWPYLPSGNIIASDMEGGLFIIGPTYTKACYLQGLVTDIETGLPIFDATVSFTAVGVTDANSNLSGIYKTGTFEPGTYDITFTKTGYDPLVISDVTLTNGVLTTINAEMTPFATFAITGQVLDAATGTGIAGADVAFKNALYNFETVADASGNFTFPSVYDDTYTLYAGQWGYITKAEEIDVNPGGTYSITLNPGYYDDFIFNNEWAVTSTATAGQWVREEPIGTEADGDESNPDLDVPADFGDLAFITGNMEGGAGEADVDNGYTLLQSPSFDLTTYADPVISYYRWFYNGGGAGFANDSLTVFVDNGIEKITIDVIRSTSPDMSEWIPIEIHIKDYMDLTANMVIIFRAADQPATGHLVEAGVDQFYVFDNVTSEPVASFNADVTSGCAPLTVMFTDNSVGAVSWSWVFEGGTPPTSNLQNPTVLYSVAGVYDVTLTASNAVGSNEASSSGYILAEVCNGIVDGGLSGLMEIVPNPFKQTTGIVIFNGLNAEMLSVTDITGRIIIEMPLSGKAETINFGQGLPAGIYYINVFKGGNSVGSMEAVKIN